MAKKKAHEVKKASSATDPEPLPWSGLACALPGEFSCSVVLPLSLRFGFQLSVLCDPFYFSRLGAGLLRISSLEIR